MLGPVEETADVEEPATPLPSGSASTTPADSSDGEQKLKFTESPTPFPVSSPASDPITTKPKETHSMQCVIENKPRLKTRKRTEVRKKFVSKSLTVKREGLGLPSGLLVTFIEEERKMQAVDELAVETADAKNALESYQYNMRDKLSGNSEFVKYGLPKDVERLTKMLEEARDWLYGEGESQSKSVYVDRLTALQQIGDPICWRKAEGDGRPSAIRALESSIAQWEAFSSETDENSSHIEKVEREKMIAKCKEARDWLGSLREAQEAKELHVCPCLTVAGIVGKQKELIDFCTAMINKPKPPPEPAGKSKDPAPPRSRAPPAPQNKQHVPPTPSSHDQQS
jgi:heat shock protein 4